MRGLVAAASKLAVIWLVVIAACFGSADAAEAPAGPWIVPAKRAARMIAAGATLLDVRKRAARRIAGAMLIDWRSYSLRGRLKPAGEIARRLRAVGISNGRWVLVFDDPLDGWGEDGRIVWMLRGLGHRRAAMVDGGHVALVRAGVQRARSPAAPGDFRVDPKVASWSIDRAGVARLVASAGASGGRTVLVDTRELREYEGQTPYGEQRGGHLPGAVHLHYRELIGSDGRLATAARQRQLLRQRGIVPEKRVVAYCSGGVRSAWFVAVLVHLGYQRVQNYPGSMWQWAEGPAGRYPLVEGRGRR